MTDQDRNKAWGFSFFADDLRLELGNKSSLMGIYQADMLFPESMKVPFLISKLVIQIMYYEIVGAVDGDVTFRVTYGSNNQTLAEAPILRADISAAPVVPSNEEELERVVHFRIPIAISPFQITEAGRIRVRAHYSDDSILKLGSIAIRRITESEFSAVTGLPAIPQS